MGVYKIMSYIKNLKPHNRKGGSFQGYYNIINKSKYRSDDKTVIYRSSLEQQFCLFCDTDPSVISWISEPDLQIRYINPIKRKVAIYWPDFWVRFKSNNTLSSSVQAVIEIKAHSMINLPKDGDITKMSNFTKKAFIVNQAKKKAAEIFCADRNIKYLVITEKSPFFKRK